MGQTKSRTNVNPGPFNSGYLRDPALNERNDVFCEENKDCPRKRRPALGHKRTDFSLKPNKIYFNATLKPTLDIDYLKDPEEFFLAYERLENAKREIQKQMGGVSLEINQSYKTPHARQRRPGLLRNNQQKLVKYKHRYSIRTSNNNSYVPSLHEIYEPGSQGSAGEDTDKNEPCLAPLESELTDSSVVEEKIDDILTDLQHSICDNPEEDVDILQLQESLQIRPIILQKLSIPDLADNQVADLKSFGCDLSKPGKVLSDTHNLLKEMRNKTSLKQRWHAGSALQQLPSASPTPPKGPFALLSPLLKHYSFSSTSAVPFPLIDDDNLPTRNTSVPASLIKSVVGKTSSVGGTRICASASGKSKEDNSKKLGFDTDIGSKESLVDIDVDIGRNDMGDGIMDVTVCRSNSEVREENMREADRSVYRDDPDLDLVNPLDQLTPIGLQSNAMDESTITSNDGEAKQCLQVLVKTKASKASVKQRKDKSYSRRKQKNNRLSRRQSLAAAGTSWESGIRRSTRIKTRPLEYWKGERLVYGRINESESNGKPYYEHAHGESRNCVLTHGLATVIGVKYMSPGSNDGKLTMKVKSYVSDEHTELLEMASKY